MEYDHRIRLKVDGKDANKGQTDVAKGFDKVKVAAAGAIGALGAFQYVSKTKEALDYADAIGKMADNIGISTTKLQEYRTAAELTGVAEEMLDRSLLGLSRRVAEAANGTGEFLTTVQMLGLELEDENGVLKSTDVLMGDIAESIKGATTQQERLFIASKAFGEEGARLVNTLKDGRAGLDALTKSASEAGHVMDEDLIRSAENLNDQMTIIGKSIGTDLKSGLIDIAKKTLPTLIDAFLETYGGIKKLNASLVYSVRVVAVEIASAFDNNFAKVEKVFAEFGLSVAELLDTLDWTGVLQSVTANMTEYYTSIIAAYKPTDDLTVAVADLTDEYIANLEETDKWLEGNRKIIDQLRSQKEETEELIDTSVNLAKARAQAVKEEEAYFEVLRIINPEAANFLTTSKRIQELYDKGLIDKERFDQAMVALSDSMVDVGEQVETVSDQMKDAVKDAAGGMADFMVEFASGSEASFQDMIAGMLKQLLKLYIQLQIIKPLMDSIFGASSGSAGGGTATAASANGNVLSNGNYMAFANGGVVNGPMTFPMTGGRTGLMGEAGPEAIIPLKRGADGKLGVASSGTSSGQTVVQMNVVVQNKSSGAETEQKMSSDGKTLNIIINDIVKTGFGNGTFDRSLSDNFGMKRRGV